MKMLPQTGIATAANVLSVGGFLKKVVLGLAD
ncbi:MAG: LPXTG cell wall anchor domain-containing protein [Rhodobacteraceae bacterium]|nr:LPXTG cell wall anchor domain-containing protein [Paracoccaceae bacterium]